MKNITLLAINSRFIHSALSVWLIKAAVEKLSYASYNISVVETTIHQSCDEIINKVEVLKPEVIGISTYIWNADKIPEIIKLLRAVLPDILIVLGGPEAEFNSMYWLEHGADYVLSGSGELTFPKFLDEMYIGTGSLYTSLDTKRYIGTGSLYTLNTPVFPGLDVVETTYTEYKKELICIDPYTDEYITSLKNKLIYFESSRGCPFHCFYCLSAGSGVDYFPMDIIKERLSKLAQLDSRIIKFVDRTFNCNAKRAYEIIEYILALDTNCCFHFETAADLFDKNTLELLKTAPPGRIQLELGVQSFFEPTLKAISRKTDLNKAAGNIKELLKPGNIHIHIDLIAGLPYETLYDFQNSFNKAYEIKAHTLQLGFLKLLHGSILRKQAEGNGICYSHDPPYEILSSPWLDEEELQVLKKVENALQNTYNKGRFLKTIGYVLSVSNLNPFEFYQALGETVPYKGTALQDYATEIYYFCLKLPCIDESKLRDFMIFDWLSMVKGKNIPAALKSQSSRQKLNYKYLCNLLNLNLKRDEVAILSSGDVIFVDTANRDPVTGLYKVYVT